MRLRRDRKGREYLDFGDSEAEQDNEVLYHEEDLEASASSARPTVHGKISLSRCSCLPFPKDEVMTVIRNVHQYADWWPKASSLRDDGEKTEFCFADSDYCWKGTLNAEPDRLSWKFLKPVKGKAAWTTREIKVSLLVTLLTNWLQDGEWGQESLSLTFPGRTMRSERRRFGGQGKEGSMVCFNMELEGEDGLPLTNEDMMSLIEIVPHLAHHLRSIHGEVADEDGGGVDTLDIEAAKKRAISRWRQYTA